MKDLPLSVVLMLVESLKRPQFSVRKRMCGFTIAGCGPRREPSLKYWLLLPAEHKHSIYRMRAVKDRRLYVSPEALDLWRRWNGEP